MATVWDEAYDIFSSFKIVNVSNNTFQFLTALDEGRNAECDIFSFIFFVVPVWLVKSWKLLKNSYRNMFARWQDTISQITPKKYCINYSNPTLLYNYRSQMAMPCAVHSSHYMINRYVRCQVLSDFHPPVDQHICNYIISSDLSLEVHNLSCLSHLFSILMVIYVWDSS